MERIDPYLPIRKSGDNSAMFHEYNLWNDSISIFHKANREFLQIRQSKHVLMINHNPSEIDNLAS